MESPYKGETGLKRILNAARNSLEGLAAAARHEDAFRQELIIAAVLIPTAFFLDVGFVEGALLIASVLLGLIVQLVNSPIAAGGGPLPFQRHPPPQRAKDLRD